jgi:hypothetical protein
MKRVGLVVITTAILSLGGFAAIKVGAFSAVEEIPDARPDFKSNQELTMRVHKTDTCGCCAEWIKHLEKSGFSVKHTDHEDLDDLKAQLGIPNNYQSCHTGVSADGYVFEGHVPAKYIRGFLKEAPENSLGLSVPAMPVGSPGMEYGNKFMPYQVLLLKKDGSVSVYAEVKTYQDQF